MRISEVMSEGTTVSTPQRENGPVRSITRKNEERRGHRGVVGGSRSTLLPAAEPLAAGGLSGALGTTVAARTERWPEGVLVNEKAGGRFSTAPSSAEQDLALAVSPLTPALSPEYRGEGGVSSSPPPSPQPSPRSTGARELSLPPRTPTVSPEYRGEGVFAGRPEGPPMANAGFRPTFSGRGRVYSLPLAGDRCN